MGLHTFSDTTFRHYQRNLLEEVADSHTHKGNENGAQRAPHFLVVF